MDPWTILGWIILAYIAIPVFLEVSNFVYESAVNYWSWYKHRNTTLREGQIWQQNRIIFSIREKRPDGRFTIRADGSVWAESEEEWKDRIRNKKARLLKDAKEH